MSDVAPSWDSVARAAGGRGAAAEAPVAQRDLLCFEIGGEPYALPVDCVREIVRMGPVTPIPRVSRVVRGLISLRGEMLQLVDLRQRLGQSEAPPAPRARILVVSGEDGRSAGLLVDTVRDVLRVPEEEIGAPLGGEPSQLVSGLCARDGRFVSVLDLEKAMDLDAGV